MFQNDFGHHHEFNGGDMFPEVAKNASSEYDKIKNIKTVASQHDNFVVCFDI